MTDRNVQFPNRYQMTKVAGTDDIYDLIPAPGTITEEGTMINKQTLLTDETEIVLFGNADDRTVDDAFNIISTKLSLIMQNVASMALTITDTAGHPIPGVYVNGVFDNNGNVVKTNASGQITGYVAEGDTTLSITNYADITPYSEVFTAVKGQSYTKTIQVTTRNFLQILSSAQYRFSENVTQIDETVLGAGGGGGRGSSDSDRCSSGAGGGGGNCVVQENVSFSPNILYPAVVGAAGKGANDGRNTATSGGNSAFLGVTATGGNAGGNGTSTGGGSPGSGNGPGGAGVMARYGSYSANGNNGSPGTVAGYSSFTETTIYSGGGASGAAAIFNYNASSATGGSPNGGNGGGAAGGGAGDGQTAKGFGGGGGGGGAASDNDGYLSTGGGGDGYQGLIALRMHLATAA